MKIEEFIYLFFSIRVEEIIKLIGLMEKMVLIKNYQHQSYQKIIMGMKENIE
jgi:hypothetical protein